MSETLPRRPRTAASAALPPSAPASHGVTRRAVLLGLLLVPANAYTLIYVETTRHATLTNAVPFSHVMFVLIVLIAVNTLLRRVAPRWALRGMELITVYVMLSVATAVTSIHHLHSLVGAISYPFAFATSSNGYEPKIWPHLPEWATVRDAEALRGYYSGNANLYTSAHYGPWLRPLLWWSLFGIVLGWVTLAVCVIFRQAWVQRERLAFPIVELPFQMVQSVDPLAPSSETPLFGDRIMWCGFGLAAGVELLNGCHYLWPSLPQIPIKRLNIGPLFTERPWSALGETNISWYPFAIGLSFIMPVELSFSCWFFFLVHKAQLVLGAVYGYDNLDPYFPYTKDQQWGASLGILLVTLVTSRRQWAAALRGRALAGMGAEARLLRWAWRTLLLGSVVLTGFGAAAGLPVGVAAAFVLLFLIVGLTVTRLRAEMGFFVHDMYRFGPSFVLVQTAGGNTLGPHTVTLLALFNATNRQFSGFVQPHHMEGMKLAERYDPGRAEGAWRLAGVIALTLLVAVPVGFWADLHLFFDRGAATAKALPGGLAGAATYRSILPDWLNDVYGPTHRLALLATAGAFAVTLALYALRLQNPGWPLHPLGLAVANTWGGLVDVFTCVLVASLLKVVVLHYGGLRGYRTVLPFFLGLMLGDFTIGPLWLLIGAVLDIPTYVFFL